MNEPEIRHEEQTVNRVRVKKTAALLLSLCLLAAGILTGCGHRVVMTRGLGEKELFRIGSGSCQEGEYVVYLLDLQRRCERLFGSTVWAGDTDGSLKEAVRNKALSEVSRVKVLGLMAIRNNTMLTNAEIDQCKRAGSDYYSSLTEDERSAVGLSEEELQDMMMEYALAVKVYRSLGTSFTERYNDFVEGIDSDMNLPLWDKLTVRKVYGDPDAKGFIETYTAYFGETLPEEETEEVTE